MATWDNLVNVLYILAFAMFIYGLMGLTGPKTAVRGNLIAAVGMGIAVIATLIAIRDTDHWIVIVAGLAVGGEVHRHAGETVAAGRSTRTRPSPAR